MYLTEGCSQCKSRDPVGDCIPSNHPCSPCMFACCMLQGYLSFLSCHVQSVKAEEEINLWHEQQRQTRAEKVEPSGCFCGAAFGLGRQREKVKPGIEERVKPGIEDVAPGVLWDAAWDGNLPVVKVLMERQVNTLAKNEEGSTAVHMAARAGHIDVLQEIVREGGLEVLMAKNNFGRRVTLLPKPQTELPNPQKY
jgi:hypothetical protein